MSSGVVWQLAPILTTGARLLSRWLFVTLNENDKFEQAWISSWLSIFKLSDPVWLQFAVDQEMLLPAFVG
jgi:hypothetical protein